MWWDEHGSCAEYKNRYLIALGTLTVGAVLFVPITIKSINYFENRCWRIPGKNSNLKTQTPGSLDSGRGMFIRDHFNGGCYLIDGSSCKVSCSHVPDDELVNSINQLQLTNCGVSKLYLQLEDMSFNNKTLVNGWLKKLDRDVGKLEISSSYLDDMGESAFSGKPFENLNALTISNSNIKILKKATFKDSRIQDFELRFNDQQRILADFDAFGYISKYLITLQLSKCFEDGQFIKNITGTGASRFGSLITLDLRYNIIPILLNNSFIDAPRLVSLYLGNCNMDSMEIGALKGLGVSIEHISIANNNLKTLEEGIFENGITDGRRGKIDIENNQWKCDCNLLWFKKFYAEYKFSLFQNGVIKFMCTENGDIEDYTTIDFCPPADTSIPTSTATSINSSSLSTLFPTGEPSDYVDVTCKDNMPKLNTSVKSNDRIFSHSVKVRNGSVSYDFYYIDNTPYYDLKVMNFVLTDYLIWFNTKDFENKGCVENIYNSVELDELRYATSYVLCLLKKDTDTVSPFDCTSLTVPAEWNNRPWITNKYIPLVIGGCAGSILMVVLLTALITFCTIRQNPMLIKGNKRVVVVRNEPADVLVMPCLENKAMQGTTPSVYTNSDGYLMPRVYERVYSGRWSRRLSTIAEADCDGSLRRIVFSKTSSDEEINKPPPLPPNHPIEKSITESAKESPSFNTI